MTTLMEPRRMRFVVRTVDLWAGLALCAAVAIGSAVQQLVPDEGDVRAFAPGWLPLVAAAIAAAGIMPLERWPRWPAVQQTARWTGLLLMVWAANGLPLDLLAAAGLIGHKTADGTIVLSTVYWPGLATRAFALATAVLLARHTLARPVSEGSVRAATWCGYAAFLLALPYPVLRVHWALGGMLGLESPGAGGEGWEPLLLAIPWMAAAALSLLLVSPRHRLPRRPLLAVGWLATGIVAMIGPAAFWSIVTALASGEDTTSGGIEFWVFGLFYCSWFLWAIAGAAATRSYQVRTSGAAMTSPA
jgi:hypothetical protein